MELEKLIHLCRLNRPIGIWLLMLPCWWGVALGFAPTSLDFYKNLVLFFVGSVLLRSAGCIFNDFIDRDLDAQVNRTKNRPLAAKTLSTLKAFMLFVAFCLGGMAVFLCLRPLAQVFAICAFFLLFLYPWAKRFTNWPQLILGLAFNSGVWVAYGQTDYKSSWPFALMYGAGIFWTLAYDTIYAFQDVEDDLKTGIKSTAVLFYQNPKKFLALCYSAMGCFCLSVAYYTNNLLLVTACCLCAVWVYRSIRYFSATNTSTCLKLFKKNQYIGLLIFLSLVFGAG
jgi:4-hydroxybenzoate polyprenyltransferase